MKGDRYGRGGRYGRESSRVGRGRGKDDKHSTQEKYYLAIKI